MSTTTVPRNELADLAERAVGNADMFDSLRVFDVAIRHEEKLNFFRAGVIPKELSDIAIDAARSPIASHAANGIPISQTVRVLEAGRAAAAGQRARLELEMDKVTRPIFEQYAPRLEPAVKRRDDALNAWNAIVPELYKVPYTIDQTFISNVVTSFRRAENEYQRAVTAVDEIVKDRARVLTEARRPFMLPMAQYRAAEADITARLNTLSKRAMSEDVLRAEREHKRASAEYMKQFEGWEVGSKLRPLAYDEKPGRLLSYDAMSDAERLQTLHEFRVFAGDPNVTNFAAAMQHDKFGEYLLLEGFEGVALKDNRGKTLRWSLDLTRGGPFKVPSDSAAANYFHEITRWSARPNLSATDIRFDTAHKFIRTYDGMLQIRRLAVTGSDPQRLGELLSQVLPEAKDNGRLVSAMNETLDMLDSQGLLRGYETHPSLVMWNQMRASEESTQTIAGIVMANMDAPGAGLVKRGAAEMDSTFSADLYELMATRSGLTHADRPEVAAAIDEISDPSLYRSPAVAKGLSVVPDAAVLMDPELAAARGFEIPWGGVVDLAHDSPDDVSRLMARNMVEGMLGGDVTWDEPREVVVKKLADVTKRLRIKAHDQKEAVNKLTRYAPVYGRHVVRSVTYLEQQIQDLGLVMHAFLRDITVDRPEFKKNMAKVLGGRLSKRGAVEEAVGAIKRIGESPDQSHWYDMWATVKNVIRARQEKLSALRDKLIDEHMVGVDELIRADLAKESKKTLASGIEVQTVTSLAGRIRKAEAEAAKGGATPRLLTSAQLDMYEQSIVDGLDDSIRLEDAIDRAFTGGGTTRMTITEADKIAVGGTGTKSYLSTIMDDLGAMGYEAEIIPIGAPLDDATAYRMLEDISSLKGRHIEGGGKSSPSIFHQLFTTPTGSRISFTQAFGKGAKRSKEWDTGTAYAIKGKSAGEAFMNALDPRVRSVFFETPRPSNIRHVLLVRRIGESGEGRADSIVAPFVDIPSVLAFINKGQGLRSSHSGEVFTSARHKFYNGIIKEAVETWAAKNLPGTAVVGNKVTGPLFAKMFGAVIAGARAQYLTKQGTVAALKGGEPTMGLLTSISNGQRNLVASIADMMTLTEKAGKTRFQRAFRVETEGLAGAIRKETDPFKRYVMEKMPDVSELPVAMSPELRAQWVTTFADIFDNALSVAAGKRKISQEDLAWIIIGRDAKLNAEVRKSLNLPKRVTPRAKTQPATPATPKEAFGLRSLLASSQYKDIKEAVLSDRRGFVSKEAVEARSSAYLKSYYDFRNTINRGLPKMLPPPREG
jgi:hypothetical protein